MSTDNKISRRDALKRMEPPCSDGPSSGLLADIMRGKRNKRIIFYFTGTKSSCLYTSPASWPSGYGTAQHFPQMVKRGKYEFEADEICIVYPIYGHMPPYMVRQVHPESQAEAGYSSPC